jgi:anti-sigma factor RsiW
MADCSEISLMLGAFDDNELEPHEMQEVAFHLARCEDCTTQLSDYSAIGRQLRSVCAPPELNGFAAAVRERIDSLPVPLGVRVSRWFAGVRETFPTALALSAATGVAALLTVLIATPYVQHFLMHRTDQVQIAKIVKPQLQQIAQANKRAVTNDSEADISRLETDSPNVAVWSEPQDDTTVIWLPDQQ